jgi:hypothetical protein
MVAIPDHLVPTKIARAEVARTLRFLPVLPGTTREMVLEADFWVHLGSVLKVDDRIEVVAQDGSFDLDLRVVAVDPRGFWAQTRVLREWPPKGEAQPKAEAQPKTWPDSEGYRVEWGGQTHKWRIIDRAGQIVGKQAASEADAIAMLDRLKREKRAA